MKRLSKIFSIIALFILCLSGLTACDFSKKGQEDTDKTKIIYADNLKLDMTSNTLKQVVTVKNYIDGDTTHFNVPTSILPSGVLKARYLAVNTPESTGKIEKWGKQASKFTKGKLENASSILIESDNDKWNVDSTGGRYLVWIWYKPTENSDYRNLNLELLENGLAIASNSFNNRYGQIMIDAIEKAKSLKLKVYSKDRDPEFFEGDPIELTLKGLRLNIVDYVGTDVAFEGNVVGNNNNGVYIEDFDEESGLYYGIYVYYGATANGDTLEALNIGNRVKVVGSCQYFEAGKSYQVSGVNSNAFATTKQDLKRNTYVISNDATTAFTKIDPEKFNEEKMTFIVHDYELDDEVSKEFNLWDLVMNTSISMDNLLVTRAYQTESSTDSDGALTLTCTCNGQTITVRTNPFKDPVTNKMINEDYFLNKTIDVKGYVGSFNGKPQIQVFSLNDIIIHE